MSGSSGLVRVRIEVARGGHVKRRPDGTVDLVSPFPCPFNYGSVLDRPMAEDGDPPDAIVLGARLPRGAVVRARWVATVEFVDAGRQDPKAVCVALGSSIASGERRRVLRFFARYAWAKRLLQAARRERGATACTGWTAI